jgi:AcrR family transcriptional regulator
MTKVMPNTKKPSKQQSANAQNVPVVVNIIKRRRLGGRSQRVQTAVFTAAIDVLMNNGFEGFRIGDVAVRAGVNETSIYRRWGNRETLLIEALLNRADADLAIPNTGSLRTDLIAFLYELIEFLQSPLGIALVQFGAISMNRPDLSPYRQKYWATRESRTRLIFERAVTRGEISANVDIPSMLELLIGPVYARMLFTGQPLSQELPERIVDIVLGNLSEHRSIDTAKYGPLPIARGSKESGR